MVHKALADSGTDLLVSVGAIVVRKFDLGAWLVSIVRWELRLIRFLPVNTFDIGSLDTSRLVFGLLLLTTQYQVPKAALNILPVVQPCRSALLHRRDGVEALLQKFAKLRLVHLEHHVVECALFKVPLYHRPQTFYAVKLWTVWGHEKKFDLQVDCPLTIDECPMRWSIVNHDVKLRVANEKASSQLVQKASESLANG